MGASTHDSPGMAFEDRHIGPGPDDLPQMLELLGVPTLDVLVQQAVPAGIRAPDDVALPTPMSEAEVIRALDAKAARNQRVISLIGMGYYGTHTPEVIRRNVLESPAWYTAYTPYQAEVSQGRLEALLNFQQTVIDLTGMEIANASLLDEATAAAEAMSMSRRVSKSASNVFVVDRDCHPQTIAVIETRARAIGFEVQLADLSGEPPPECFGALAQYPGSSGRIQDWSGLGKRLREKGALLTIASDLLALTLLEPPSRFGADIVVGSSQRFGIPMGFGGPHAAFFATLDRYKRSTPGRLIGVSVDRHGNSALRMALQTREQHIRREKATSNICTAQVLLAVIAGFYAVYHGPAGLTAIAARVHRLTGKARTAFAASGLEPIADTYFDTVTLRAPGRAHMLVAAAAARGINLRLIDEDQLSFSFDETVDESVLSRLLEALGAARDESPGDGGSGVPEALRRTAPYLEHPVFSRHRSETEMLRYMRRLSAKDLALDRAMIPLGSCTMKLNATTEMLAVTHPAFANVHPYAPEDQVAGYLELIGELGDWLAECTGFDSVSMQPNAGSQGEFAGLLAISHYHASRGEVQRDICLIPASAHGTNPASAQMAGMRVVVVTCDRDGNVDLDDLRARAVAAGDELACLMVTYPSTHGVYEASIREMCDIVHLHGGQVYMDGANLNALLGLAKPGELGADVAHINLHKTFCIPHGGGGPGMGPIGVAPHLAPFLPGHPLARRDPGAVGPVSAAPFGSALILPISWTYIALMGAAGLERATKVAILNANYIATRLQPYFPVLYTGQNGRVAHECIIDLRALKQDLGVTVDDVAKRLVDYGFHAPTMSFPVADTLMIEPTESEGLEEIERFCAAMIAIKGEIDEVAAGALDPEQNMLKLAPHTAEEALGDDWNRPYSRRRACFPLPGIAQDKYWPPVGRIDNVAGDKNLVCTCPPMSAYEEAAD